MADIKLTKTELKSQRDSLKRFTRFLPTLQLKKQQLQMEVQRVKEEIEGLRKELDTLKLQTQDWIELFSSPDFTNADISCLVVLESVETEMRNVAGVDVPYFVGSTFKVIEYDLFSTPAWFDAALNYIKKLIELSEREKIMAERMAKLEQELRTTNQRVNLFEKVKIPECKDNIRKIRIYLGDQETAAVGRSKIAKRKMQVA